MNFLLGSFNGLYGDDGGFTKKINKIICCIIDNISSSSHSNKSRKVEYER